MIVMVMALDHANGFISHRKGDPELWAGPFPDYEGDWAAFLTRAVTHLSAPGFFFLLGTGAVLFAHARSTAGWSQARISAHLALRGAMLMALQFIWENGAWTFGRDPAQRTYIGVLFGLGGCMIAAAALHRIPARWLTGLGAALLITIEVTLPASGWTPRPTWELMVLFPGFSDNWFSLYPVVPWIGVSMLGMAFGHWVHRDQAAALSNTLKIGLISLGAFAVIRALDGFGNIRSRQSDTVLEFFNVVKYPPAISFLLLTLGIGFVATWWLSKATNPVTATAAKVIGVFGRAPLFFYLLHLYLYAQLGAWLGTRSLPEMYLWWLAGLAVLYPACFRFGRFKRGRPPASPWRFL